MSKSANVTGPDNPHPDDIWAGKDLQKENVATETMTVRTEGDRILVHLTATEDAESTQGRSKESTRIETETINKGKEKTATEKETDQDQERRSIVREDRADRAHLEDQTDQTRQGSDESSIMN